MTAAGAAPARRDERAAHLGDLRSQRLDVGGAALHYVDDGPRDAPAVLMLHGNPTWSFYYRNLATRLRAHHRVIVPDHVGCGLSDKPLDYDYRLDTHIGNVERLAGHLGLERVTLVVHDWGAAIGLGWATRQPSRVARLVILNGAAFHVDRCPLRIRVCRVPGLGALLVCGLNGFARAALRYASADPRAIDASVRAGYLAPYRSWRERIGLYRFVQDIPLEPDHPTRDTVARIEAGLPALASLPALVVWGARDFCFTERHFLPRWRAAFPAAEVHVLADAGHYVLEDAGVRAGDLIESFLERTAA